MNKDFNIHLYILTIVKCFYRGYNEYNKTKQPMQRVESEQIMNKKEVKEFIKKHVIVEFERVIKETFSYNNTSKVCMFYTVSNSGVIWFYYIDFKLEYATMNIVACSELSNARDISKTVFNK